MDFAQNYIARSYYPSHPANVGDGLGADDGKGYGRFHINRGPR